jgi:Flp pilus assembly protein TadG
MWFGPNSDVKRDLRSEKGGVAVEFAIIFPVLMLLVFGIIDLGHGWYMKHLISNASREGARYGTRSTGSTTAANALIPSISDYILNTSAENGNNGGYGLKVQLPGDNPMVTPSGPGYTDSTPGKDLYVTVTATKTWWVVSKFIPGMGPTSTISSTTCMKVE